MVYMLTCRVPPNAGTDDYTMQRLSSCNGRHDRVFPQFILAARDLQFMFFRRMPRVESVDEAIELLLKKWNPYTEGKGVPHFNSKSTGEQKKNPLLIVKDF